jgi:CheY-like chemotaxis protein
MSRVLVVDDCPDNAQSLSRLLRRWGHDAVCASDADSALLAAVAHRPEAALLDLGLPGAGGDVVARRLLALPGPRPLLLALTGYADEHHRGLAREAGFDAYLVKPVAPDLLRRVLEAAAPA